MVHARETKYLLRKQQVLCSLKISKSDTLQDKSFGQINFEHSIFWTLFHEISGVFTETRDDQNTVHFQPILAYSYQKMSYTNRSYFILGVLEQKFEQMIIFADDEKITKMDLVSENITFSLINTLTSFLFNAMCLVRKI